MASAPSPAKTEEKVQSRQQIWWSNAVFFVAVHLSALIGVYYFPPWSVRRETLILWFMTWQLSDFGITIGYHRLYSHKAFRATLGVRIVLAILGSAAFQGSIKPKWWCLRHRMHHRYTDDPLHDPYAATRGLLYSHMGWIFYKPTYDRMSLIERDDLENDPVVRIQHKYYVPLAILCGFIFPPTIGLVWGDALGSFIWGGLVARLFIWHCTFLVNSLAHWEGLQPYSDENTSRGNLLLAVLTGGEGNHNFHSFPHDFRSGPSITDWDPSKWIILLLGKLGLIGSLRRAGSKDLDEAISFMKRKYIPGQTESSDEPWRGAVWDFDRVRDFIREKPGQCVVIIDNFVVDVTSYLGEHPGGGRILRNYSIHLESDHKKWEKGDWGFNGGMNNHSRSAKRRMKELRVAKFAQ